MSLQAHNRVIAPGQYSFFPKNVVAAVTLKYGLLDTVHISPVGFSPSLLDVA